MVYRYTTLKKDMEMSMLINILMAYNFKKDVKMSMLTNIVYHYFDWLQYYKNKHLFQEKLK